MTRVLVHFNVTGAPASRWLESYFQVRCLVFNQAEKLIGLMGSCDHFWQIISILVFWLLCIDAGMSAQIWWHVAYVMEVTALYEFSPEHLSEMYVQLFCLIEHMSHSLSFDRIQMQIWKMTKGKLYSSIFCSVSQMNGDFFHALLTSQQIVSLSIVTQAKQTICSSSGGI